MTPPSITENESPVVAFVQLERYNSVLLVQYIHGSLAALSKAIRGTNVLTNQIRSVAESLLKQEVV